MSLADLLRRAEPAGADVLAGLTARRDALADRVAAVRDRASARDREEAAARTELEAAAAEGAEIARFAEELSRLADRRTAIGIEAAAAEGALRTAEAALAAESSRLHEAAVDAEVSRLEAAKAEIDAAFEASVISTGMLFERLLATEGELRRTVLAAGRTVPRGYVCEGRKCLERAEEAARDRARSAFEAGTAGERSSLASHGERFTVPFASLARR